MLLHALIPSPNPFRYRPLMKLAVVVSHHPVPGNARACQCIHSRHHTTRKRSRVATSQPVALRRLIGGLYLKVHPDILQRFGENVQKTNEDSLQRLNDYLDVAEKCCNGQFGISAANVPQKTLLTFYYLNSKHEEDALQKQTFTIDIPRPLYQAAETKNHHYNQIYAMRQQWRQFTDKTLRSMMKSFDVHVSDSGKLIESDGRIIGVQMQQIFDKSKLDTGRILSEELHADPSLLEDPELMRYRDDPQIARMLVSRRKRYIAEKIIPLSVYCYGLTSEEEGEELLRLATFLMENYVGFDIKNAKLWGTIRIVLNQAQYGYKREADIYNGRKTTSYVFLPKAFHFSKAANYFLRNIFSLRKGSNENDPPQLTLTTKS